MTLIHPMAHRLDIPGLTEADAAAPVTDQHKVLLQRVKCINGLASARLAHVRGYLHRRKVLTLDGTLVHDDHTLDDHTVWLETQLAGPSTATRQRRAVACTARATQSVQRAACPHQCLPQPPSRNAQ